MTPPRASTTRTRSSTTGRRKADGLSPEAWELLTDRLDQQDLVLGQILAQAQKTNGRVTALELDKGIRDAVALEKANAITAGETRKVRKTDGIRLWIFAAIGALATLLGGFISATAHLHI